MPAFPGIFVVGLTGGIGSGKSTVGNLLREAGLPVLDVDTITRKLLEAPPRDLAGELRRMFGDDVVLPGGQVDRKLVASRTFADSRTRGRLESLIHPRISSEVSRWLSQMRTEGHRTAIVEIPLLVEAGWQTRVDLVVVVDTPPDQQILRTQARTGMSTAQIQARMASQATRQQRLDAAHEVITNCGPLSELSRQVQRLVTTIRAMEQPS